MKLHTHHIVLLHYPGKRPSIFCNRSSCMHNRRPPRMGVIDKPTTLHPMEQPRIRPHPLDRNPPHMRRLQLRTLKQSRKPFTHPLKMSQPSNPRSLSRSLKQPLQPHTNPKKPSPVGN